MISKIEFPNYNAFREEHSFVFDCNGEKYELKCYPVLEMFASLKFGSDIVIAFLKNDKLVSENCVWGFTRENYPIVIEKCKELVGENGGC